MKLSHSELKNRFLSNELLCKKVLNIFSLFSNKTRFRILCLLNEGDFCVQEIVDIINAGEVSFVSQQLKSLSLAGFLTKKKEKKQVFYHLADKKIRDLIDYLQSQYITKGGINKEQCS